APRWTSPTMVAVSATNAVGSIWGRLPWNPRIIDGASLARLQDGLTPETSPPERHRGAAERGADGVGSEVAGVVALATGDEGLGELAPPAEGERERQCRPGGAPQSDTARPQPARDQHRQPEVLACVQHLVVAHEPPARQPAPRTGRKVEDQRG